MGKPSKEARRKRRKENRQRSAGDSVSVPGPLPTSAAANTPSAPMTVTSGTPVTPSAQRYAAIEFTGAVSPTVARRRHAGGSTPAPGPLPSLSATATPSAPVTTTPAAPVTPSPRRYVSIAPTGPSNPTAARLRAIAGTPSTRAPPSIESRSSVRPGMSTRDKITALLAVRPAVKATASTPSPAPASTRPRATASPSKRAYPAEDDMVDEDIYRASDINANDGGSNDDSGRDADGNEDNNVGGGEDNND
ncbi:hypothetical protein SPI_03417 [Niveomyces insectorum RCEF 264]|uniref:Uncharacterized protein n=1 Tax=Niveomyces insectorum RCEF 264 TaxID=1081102 RepID=A0A167W2G3_9HYPO|nr:hypothetical protein SPI_03417 [Niveomyces insectorum RCEF 264]